MTKILNDIFEKDQKGSYTKEALLYQDILQYTAKTNSQEFRFWEIGPWLIKNNKEFRDAYDRDLKFSSKKNTTITYAVQKKQDRIKAKINDLIMTNLIYKKGTAKGKKIKPLDVDLFAHTEQGYFITLILERINPEKRKETNDKIFQFIDSHLKINDDSPSSIIFYSQLFRKCRERAVFDKLVDHIIDILHSKNYNRIKNIQELFTYTVDLGFGDKHTKGKFMTLWNETLDELDPKVKSLVLFQMKLDAEARFQNSKDYLTKEYEEVRFKNRNNHDRIVVEGTCKKCGTGPIVLQYLEYRKIFALVGLNDLITLDCPICNTKNGLVICNFNIS
jgi:hypothetical protein